MKSQRDGDFIKRTKNRMNEAEMTFLEEHIPELAQAATTAAYWQTLAAGGSVVTCEEGVIYETFPDGTKKVIKTIDPPFPMAVGTRRTLR